MRLEIAAMKQITIRISAQQEQTLKKAATKTQQSITGYIRYLIDCELQNQSQDTSTKLKPVPRQDYPGLQSQIIKLLYRILFLNQVGFGKIFPDEHKDIKNMVDNEASLALAELLSEMQKYN